MNDCSCLWIILLLISCGSNNCNGCNQSTSFNSSCSCNCLVPLLITWLFYGNGCGGANFNNNNCGCNNF